MSKELATPNANLPAALRAAFEQNHTSDLISSSGGFPVLSIRGKAFRVKVSGEESPLINAETGDPLPSLELVLLGWQKGLSKIYYQNAYQEGDDEPPACFSVDGVYPDPQAAKKQARSCAECPHNVWGSKISPQGNKTKACSDSKRLAVTFASNLHNEELGGPMLLRVPAASLKDLTTFARNMVAKGYNANTIVVRIGFDIQVSFPKLTFKAVRALREEELYTVAELIQSEQVATIMSSAPVEAAPAAPPPKPQLVVDTEFDEEPVAPPPVAVAKPAPAKPAPAKAAKPAPAKAAAPKEPEDTGVAEIHSLDDVLSKLEALDSLE